jgi:hypothetical protein
METMEKQNTTFEPDFTRGETRMVARDQVVEIEPMVVIEQRNKAFERLLEYAVRATEASHWFDQNGKPYLGAGGAEAVARRCGVKITNVRRERIDGSDEKGRFYDFIVEATFSLPGGLDSVEAIGTCSSRDNFLGTETNAGREIAEVDTGNILKAAYSNCKVNGVTSLLGIRGISWERLAQFGIEKDKATKVEYRHGAKGGGNGKEFTFPFGKAKGKTPAEASDQDLTYYLEAFRKNVEDPEKQKYRAQNEKQVKAVEEEIAHRKAGKPVTPWSKIQDIADGYGVPHEDLGGIVKTATGKSRSSELVEDDVPKVEAALAEAAKQQGAVDFD